MGLRPPPGSRMRNMPRYTRSGTTPGGTLSVTAGTGERGGAFTALLVAPRGVAPVTAARARWAAILHRLLQNRAEPRRGVNGLRQVSHVVIIGGLPLHQSRPHAAAHGSGVSFAGMAARVNARRTVRRAARHGSGVLFAGIVVERFDSAPETLMLPMRALGP